DVVGQAIDQSRYDAPREAYLGFRVIELGGFRCHNHVCHHGDNKRAAYAPPADGGNDGLVGLDTDVWNASPELWHVRQICACRECVVASACQHGDATRIVGMEGIESVLQLNDQLFVQRVFLFRPVQCDDGDAVVLVLDKHAFV